MGLGAASTTDAPSARKLDAIRIVTRCTDMEQFTQLFRRFCNPTSCFIPSTTTRPVGTETAFSIRLADQTPVLRGVGVVLDAWTHGDNPFRRPGVHLGIMRLSADSIETFQQLLIPTPPRLARGSRTPSDTAPNPIATIQEERAPGSSFILPANPLTEMDDDSLDAFVECQLTEGGETEPVSRLSAADVDFEGPLTLPNNPAISLAAAAAQAVVGRAPIRTMMGVAPLVAPRVYAAPEPVKTELVDRVTAMPRDRVPLWETITGFFRRWWLASTVAGVILVIAIVVIASSRDTESKSTPTAIEPTPTPPILAPEHKPTQPQARLPLDSRPPVTNPKPPETPATKTFGTGPCTIALETKPVGAQIKVDGVMAGISPLTIAGPCAKRKIEAIAPRYALTSKWVQATAEPAKAEISLTRPKHELKILSTPPGSTVFVNGKSAGTTPTTVEVPGFLSVTITIQKSGFVDVKKKYKSAKPKDELYVKLVKK